SLIDTELFDEIDALLQVIKDALRCQPVDLKARAHHDCFGANEWLGAVHRHRGARAIFAGFIRCAGYHTTPRQTADQDWPAHYSWPGSLLTGCETRIHIYVQTPTLHTSKSRSSRSNPEVSDSGQQFPG